jgi:hypothetical protein
MRSLRLDDELDERVRQAAAVEGASVSEFLRRAAADRVESTLAAVNPGRLDDVLGAINGGGGRARDTGSTFTRLLTSRAFPR